HDVLAEGGVWPVTTQILLSYRDRDPVRLRAQLSQAKAEIKEVAGNPCPEFVFANDQDYAYGRFLLDPQSQKAVMEKLGDVHDLFERTLLWGSLWDSVREARLAPRDYLELAQRLLPDEKDESLAQSIIGHVTTALHRYVNAEVQQQFVPRFESVAADLMMHSPDQGLRIIWFRALRGLAQTPTGKDQLKALLSGKASVPGVELRQLDRWNMVTALVALKDAEAAAVFAAEQKRDPSGDGQKYAYAADAARPDPATKQRYFQDYLHNPARPEDWVEQSLGAFNYWNQAELTQPFLKPALDALPQVKRERKIFFLLAWLNAFIGGQQSATAQAQVHEFLKTANLDHDLQLKILEVVDELDRTVRVRQTFP